MLDPDTFATNNPLLLLILAVVVVLLVTALVVWALKEGREVSFWPPRIGARPIPQVSEPRPADMYESQHRESTSFQTSEWWTEWSLSSESLLLQEAGDGTVTGQRVTHNSKGSTTYAVAGYAKGGWYWLEYHDASALGGGTMHLHALTSGRLRGVVIYPDRTTGDHLCAMNQWLPRGGEEKYHDTWRHNFGAVRYWS